MTEDWRKELLGAIARGWCAVGNTHKEMDCRLAVAIAKEIEPLLTTRTEQAVAEERMRVREMVEKRVGVTRRTDLFTNSYNDGHDNALSHILSALQDPRRGGELNK